MLRFQIAAAAIVVTATALFALCLPAWAETGEASWYGGRHHGRLTASGERFDQNAMTAAHRTLPFGTRVRVCLLPKGRCVVVRISDRGPSIRGRVIDLAREPARRLGIVRRGLARVRVERLR